MDDYGIEMGRHRICGKFWGPKEGLPTIALHGYLDNANSFDRLAPLLKHRRIFAMDFAGHGASSHRQSHELYSGLSDIKDVLSVADHFGWQHFHVLGHSMGAEIGSQMAGMFPERVASLVCLDGFCSTNDTNVTLDNLASSVSSSFKDGARLKVFPSLEAMSQRLSEVTGQSLASASAIVARGYKEVVGGYTWVSDPRIKGSGPLEFTRPQLEALILRLAAPALVIVADVSNLWLQRSLEVLVTVDQPLLTMVSVPAHHHLHMHDECAEVARLIECFDAKQPLAADVLSPERYRILRNAAIKTVQG